MRYPKLPTVPLKKKPVLRRLFQSSRKQYLPRKVSRVTKHRIDLVGSGHVLISFRRFRTQKSRRSKIIRQLVFQTPFASFREVAIAYYPARRKRKQLKPAIYRFAPPAALIALGITGSVYFSLHLVHPLGINANARTAAAPVAPPPAPPAPQAPKSMGKSEPTRIRIPKVSIDTTLSPTGLKADGSLNTPDVFDEAFWYNGSPTPGEIGPSVIVGHVDSPTNIAVFWRLRELVPGDQVIVDRADGSAATFVVRGTQEFPQSEFPTTEVYGDIPNSGIRLITCSGTFSEATQHYSHNMVVYGELI